MPISLNDEKLTGLILSSFSNIVPEGFLLCDGSARNRADFPNLFAISPFTQSVITVTTGNIITWNNHGLATGHSIQFSTSGTLPTGLTPNTVYYIRVLTTSTFNLYTTLAQSMNIASATGQVVFTVSGSGTHTGLVYYWGNGDGATTFHLPDCRGVHLRGIGSPQNFLDSTSYAFSMGQKIDDTVQDHGHNTGFIWTGDGAADGNGASGSLRSRTETSGMNAGRRATETRVKSIGVNFFIKY